MYILIVDLEMIVATGPSTESVISMLYVFGGMDFSSYFIILNILSIVKRLSMIKLIWVMKMISYKPFYETLYKKGITEYYLIFKQGFSANTLHRMKHGEAISTKTLDALCYVLDCEVGDIIRFEKE